MKRSRRVVLTMMGTAAVGAVSTGFARAQPCGPGLETVPGPNGQPGCRAIRGGSAHGGFAHGGFGGTAANVHGHGHGHAGG